jgi:hypothetical protein
MSRRCRPSRRAHSELEDPWIGLGDAHHARIDDELELRDEPGGLECLSHRAVGVRDDAHDEPHVARPPDGLSGFAVGLVAQPDRHVEATPPFGDCDPLGIVADPEILH